MKKIISNIKKDGFEYVGDISLLSGINLGHGWTYLDNQNSNITTKEALMPGNNDGYRLKANVISAYQKMNTFSEFMQSITKEKTEIIKVLTVWNS